MADWTTEVFENEYLPADATDVNAIVTVTCVGSPATPPKLHAVVPPSEMNV